MVIESAEILTIRPGDEGYLKSFLAIAGSSLESFRYFDKRPLSVIKNHIVTCVLMQNEQVIGYGHLDKDGNEVWLGIAIAEKFKGMGYGNKIMAHLVSKAQEKGIKNISLTVDLNNSQARKLYEKFGFSLVRQVNERSILMEYTGGH